VRRLICDVPGCKNRWDMGWVVFGQMKRVCMQCFRRHCNKDDPFSLFEAFGLAPPEQLDQFGHPLGRDYEQMIARAEKQDKEVTEVKKEKSLKRLKDWQDGNKSKSKCEPPPRPVKQVEFDAIVDDILGG